MLVVQKYGGATLATPEKIKNVARRISELKISGNKVVAIVSAMGKTTNELIALAHQVSEQPSLRELDMLLSVGERTSMALVTMALHDLNCSAISFTGSQAGIITTESHINADIIDVKAFRVEQALNENKIVVLAGFQGVSQNAKEITTLGRGGSDTSAVAIANYLKAARCEILKDVEGVMTADPQIIPEAKLIKTLSLEQLYEMTFWGAKVLHHKSAKMALDFNVPLYIGPAKDQSTEGTFVHSNKADLTKKCLSINSHQFVFSIKTELPQDLFLINFLNFLKQKQIAEPLKLLTTQPKTSEVIHYFTLPEESFLQLLRINTWPTDYSMSNSELSSISLTFNHEQHTDTLESNIRALNVLPTPVFEHSVSGFSQNFMIERSVRLKALKKLHQTHLESTFF